ncbi:MAG: polymer-forming cytoskeletal protein [Desulfobacteraceae bacterium]|nr:polymer-forming cytoskeletal protein [Desulfobacteraceae bacterium]
MKDDSKKISIIDEGFTVDGTVTGKGRVIVKGTVKGTLTGDNVIIAKKGAVYAQAKVNKMTIGGLFDGEVEVDKSLTLLSTGNCSGKILCKELIVESGGILNATVICKNKSGGFSIG